MAVRLRPGAPDRTVVYRVNVEGRALLGEVGERDRNDTATRKRLIPDVW